MMLADLHEGSLGIVKLEFGLFLNQVAFEKSAGCAHRLD